jgi:uncharacterized membrane protein YcjF (UPF0283 family)
MFSSDKDLALLDEHWTFIERNASKFVNEASKQPTNKISVKPVAKSLPKPAAKPAAVKTAEPAPKRAPVQAKPTANVKAPVKKEEKKKEEKEEKKKEKKKKKTKFPLSKLEMFIIAFISVVAIVALTVGLVIISQNTTSSYPMIYIAIGALVVAIGICAIVIVSSLRAFLPSRFC